MIEIKNLTKKFKNKIVLNDLSLTLPSKGIVTLNGKSGIGKTTLLNIISLEDKNYDGIVKYYNQDIINKHEFKEKFIFYNRYEDNLVKSLTVDENLKLFLNSEQYNTAMEYINKHELHYLLHTKTNKISSGEYQKICLILALSRRALITLLDEPVGNIDADTIKDFYDDIVELGKEVLVIYVSHYEENIDSISDFIYTLKDGEIICLKNYDIVKCNLIEQDNKFSIKNFFKMSRLWNKNTPKLRLVLFNIVFYTIVAVLLFNIYLLTLSKYDFYAYELKNASVESFYFTDNVDVSLDCINNIEIKNLENCSYQTLSYEGELEKKTILKQLTFASNYTEVKYMGITDELSILGVSYTLDIYEIIITDYIADEIKCNVGDVVEFSNNKMLVKAIIETDYLEQAHNPEYLEKYDYYYNIIYVSQKYIDYKASVMANYSFDTSTEIFGINTRILNYDIVEVDLEKSSRLFYTEFPVEKLDENSFYCGLDYFYSTFNGLPGYEEFDFDLMLDYLSKCIGNSYEVTFTIGEYSFSKNMVFKGVITEANNIVFCESFYNNIRAEVGLNDINYSYKTEINAKKIDETSPSFNEFVRSLEDRSDYIYVNKSLFDNYYDVYITKNETLSKTLILEIILLTLLGVIYYYSIYKSEFKEYKKLQTKGYKLKYYFAINYAYRIVVHVVVFLFLFIGFMFLMGTLI